jgi:sugar lactone lactonase YvrE
MEFSILKLFRIALLLSVALLFSACGGAGAGTAGATPAGAFTASVGVTVSGLSGKVVLQDDAGDNLPISTDGQFAFASPLTIGKTYRVTVLTQPTGQICTVSPETVTVSSNNAVNNVVVTCTTKTYNIRVTVAGLTSEVVLDNNGERLNAATDGSFAFTTKIAYGKSFNVSVITPPVGEACTVTGGNGTVPANDVIVTVVCSAQANSLKITVTGLTGTGFVLQASNGDSLIVNANGTSTFLNQIAFGSPYSVTVYSQPSGQRCSVAGGSGTMPASDVNVSITCIIAYTVGGIVSQLNGSMVLQNNATDNLTVSANGPFTFPTAIPSGGSYDVSVLTQPIKQRCMVTNGAGNVTSDNIGSISLSCISPSQMGGAMQGLALNLTPTVNTLVSSLSGSFSGSYGITTDGVNLYVANATNNAILKIVIDTGVVTTLAGTGAAGAADGQGIAATFNFPRDITTDGTNLYVADAWNNKIRKIVIATGMVSSFTGMADTQATSGAMDGSATSATFANPIGVTTDGTSLYVADTNNQKIRRIVIATGEVSSLTGATNMASATGVDDGPRATATFYSPQGITTDGINLYVVDWVNDKIRKIVIATGEVSSLTGGANTAGVVGVADGQGAKATFYAPYGITSDGSNLYVADMPNHKIRKIVIATGEVSSATGRANVAGVQGSADGVGPAATFSQPLGITTDGASLYVVDKSGSSIRKIQ